MVGSRWRALRILHLALLAALAIWGGIAYMLPKPQHAPAGFAVLIYAMAGAAAIELFVVIPVLRIKQMPPRERVGDGRELDLEAKLEGKLGASRCTGSCSWSCSASCGSTRRSPCPPRSR